MSNQLCAEAVHQAASVCFRYCDISTLAQACSAAKCLQATCISYLRDYASTLLPHVAADPDMSHSQRPRAMRWLITQGCYDQAVLDSFRGKLLAVPNVQPEVASLLVSHGLRYSWMDVADAAAKYLSGVEVWLAVEAVDTAPVLAKMICRNCVLSEHHDDSLVSMQVIKNAL